MGVSGATLRAGAGRVCCDSLEYVPVSHPRAPGTGAYFIMAGDAGAS